VGTIAAIGLALALASGAESPQATAKALAGQGVKEYAEGHYAEARRDLLASYDLVPVPILLFNLGQCARAAGHLDEAIDFYGKYLKAAPDAPNAALARSNLKEATEARDRPVPGLGASAPPTVDAQVASEQPQAQKSLLPDTPLAAPQAVSEAPPPNRSHWLGATLAAAAVICAGFAIVGVVREVQYDQTTPATTWAQYRSGQAQYINAQNWEYAAVVLGIAAAGGTAGALLTW
jgi:tetratricopeptide (TPR) repeat protein